MMSGVIKYTLLESCWKESLKWTFSLVNVLREASGDKNQKLNLERSTKELIALKNKLDHERNQILSKLDQIDLHVKPVRNFIAALEKLLDSTEINLSKRSKMIMKPYDLFDSIEFDSLTKMQLQRDIEIVMKNIEENWTSFNQSYGRMLIKLKVNGNRIEF